MIVMLQPVTSIRPLGTCGKVPVAMVLCIQRQHHAQSVVIFGNQAALCASNVPTAVEQGPTSQ